MFCLQVQATLRMQYIQEFYQVGSSTQQHDACVLHWHCCATAAVLPVTGVFYFASVKDVCSAARGVAAA